MSRTKTVETRGRKPIFQPNPKIKLGEDEMETHINKTAAENVWAVFTDDPVMIEKLRKVATGKTKNFGVEFTLDFSQIVFVKKDARVKRERKQYTTTPEQRAARAERMRLYHQNKAK